MRLLSAVSLALCANQAIAHSDLGGHAPVPNLVGGRKFLREFKGERRWERAGHSLPMARSSEPRKADGLEERGNIEERQNTNGRCGARYGSCATGYCCSYEGYCGKDEEYCTSPDCQLNYGSGCDGNQKPSGVDTSTIARPKLGSVTYGGAGIYDCVNDGDIALTFDDGPWDYTNDLLDKLAKYDAKATFFITGTNLHKGQINDPSTPWPSVIQRMAAEGHQVASHTWSHENYSQLTTAQFQNQIYWNEIALNDILGYFPTYMRPPYSICPTRTCGAQLADMGYHVIYFDLDTEGYLHDDPTEIQVSKDIWDDTVPGTNPCRSGFLQIEHDIHYQTVYNLTDYFLTSLFESGYRSVTVGQCLGDAPANWYRAGSKAVPSYTFKPREPTGTWSCLTASPTSTSQVSTDGDCGPGITCQGSRFGNCCSVNGFCGASIDYCGSNCNPQFGGCSVGDDPLPSDLPLPSGPDDPIPSSTTSGPAPTNTLQVSIDGNCGDGFTCDGSEFGNCCSQYGFCGSNDDYCLEGCQPIFGSGCKGSGSTTTTTTTPTPTTTTTTTPTPTTTTRSSSSSSTRTTTTKTTTTKTTTTKTTTTKTTTTTKSTTTKTTTTRTTTTSPTPTVKPVTKDGRCGPQYGTTCTGSLFGSCCNGLTNRCGILCLIGNCIPGYGSCPLGKETTGEQIAAS